MQVCLRHAVAVALYSITIAGAASAQTTPTAAADTGCNPNSVPTQALGKATFSMQRAFQTFQAKNDATKDLKDAIRFLTTPPDKKEQGDSLGRAYYLGQAYILMLQQPNAKPIGRRGDYGIATDTILSIDLLAAADTAFTRVEKGWPACAPEMAKWRQQQPWLDALNGAITAINANPPNVDSAEALAKRSLLIERSAPYAYSVLASVANNRKDYVTAMQMLKQSLELGAKDTSYAKDRPNSLYDLANIATARAESAPAADRTQFVKDAVAAWQDFIPLGAANGLDTRVANAEQSIVRLLKSTDDSSAISQAYSAILADPSKFGEQALLNAGVIATRAKQPADAAKFFAAVLEQNPNQRDALNNLAASYVMGNEHQKMFPIVDRLVSLDPNNSDNWLLYAYAYTGLLKGTKDPKETKMYTDSLIKYNSKAEKLPAKVSLTEFAHGTSSTSLSGTIENRSTTSKTYTMEIEFLDKTGAVVGSKTLTIGPVAPKDSAPFSTMLESVSAVAFRYKPLS